MSHRTSQHGPRESRWSVPALIAALLAFSAIGCVVDATSGPEESAAATQHAQLQESAVVRDQQLVLQVGTPVVVAPVVVVTPNAVVRAERFVPPPPLPLHQGVDSDDPRPHPWRPTDPNAEQDSDQDRSHPDPEHPSSSKPQ